ncbi:MAG TPA: hypothetical protein DD400_03055, partial [Rhodospirillaceae bacterium]|nr:hypothetical protein [Rhodospirillaceae bacterium]
MVKKNGVKGLSKKKILFRTVLAALVIFPANFFIQEQFSISKRNKKIGKTVTDMMVKDINFAIDKKGTFRVLPFLKKGEVFSMIDGTELVGTGEKEIFSLYNKRTGQKKSFVFSGG